MITRDLIVMFTVIITLLIGVGLRLKKDTNKRWNILFL